MKTPIIVVSGLPRSGTSMMMNMLQAGGVDLVMDNNRKEADNDNPLGYFEDERVKKLREYNSWLNEIHGKAVKVISILLYDLPVTNRYQIVFMQRRMDQILASQKEMMRKLCTDRSGIDDATMAKKFNKHLRNVERWIEKQKNMDCLYVDFHDVIQDSTFQAKRVAEFLDRDLDVERMVQAVDKKLYRNR